MNARFAIIILLLSFSISNIYSNDTIRYELLKLEKIQVDTLVVLDVNRYVGCVNLQFKKGADTIVNFSFINLLVNKNPYISYNWTQQSSIANFTLKNGMNYKLQLIPLCEDQLDKGSFYAKYADFTDDKCFLKSFFNHEKYKSNFNPPLTHLAHDKSRVFKVIWFHPTYTDIANSGYKMDFIPIKLSK